MPEIIGQNERFRVLYKPAGLIVHSDGRTAEPSLAQWLIEQFPELEHVGDPWVSPQGEIVPVGGLVHRLDRTTSGVIIGAKNTEAFDYAKNEFKARRVQKIYNALIVGHIADDAGTISAEIVRLNTNPKRWAAEDRSESQKRTAITDWKVIKRLQRQGHNVSLVEVSPHTGRTHQIRVHFAHIGYPLLGDSLYGKFLPSEEGCQRPMLHAQSIRMNMPSGFSEEWSAPWPEDFRTLLDRLP